MNNWTNLDRRLAISEYRTLNYQHR